MLFTWLTYHVGVIVHFLDADYKFRTFLLSLPDIIGQHTGANLAELSLQIFNEYGISNKVGFFVGDNAGNNDTCTEEIAMELGFDASQRRCRCFGHIINLVAKALLFGEDKDAIETDSGNVQEILKEFQDWRKYGPIGKLHNILMYITRSDQRYKEFMSRQEFFFIGDTEAPNSDKVELKRIITPVETRWNSWEEAMERAIELRPVLDEVIEKVRYEWDKYWNRLTANSTKRPPRKHRKKPAIYDDYMTDDDWHIITVYYNMLRPLKEATLALQGRYQGSK